MPPEGLTRSLQTLCRSVFPDRGLGRVLRLERLTAGWENEIYAFDLASDTQDTPMELVLRLFPGHGAAAKATHEFVGMRRLHRAGYPVPRVFHLEAGPARLGMPAIVMQRIAGETMWPVLSAAEPTRQEELARLFVGLLVDLHRLDWRPFADDTRQAPGPYDFVDAWLTEARGTVERFAAHAFVPVLDWIEARRTAFACHTPAVVHQDFHPANILVSPGGRATVIDWTGIRVADPRTDLAWTLLLTDCYMGSTWRQQLLEHYEDLSGVKAQNLTVFLVAACGRRLFDVYASLQHGPQALGMRPEATAQIRADLAAHRRVYELLQTYSGVALPEVEKILRASD